MNNLEFTIQFPIIRLVPRDLFIAILWFLASINRRVYDPDGVLIEIYNWFFWLGLHSSWGCIVSISVFDWGFISFSKGWGSIQEWRCNCVDTVGGKSCSNEKGLFISPAAMWTLLFLMFLCIWKSVNVTLMQKYFILKYFSLKKIEFSKNFRNFFWFFDHCADIRGTRGLNGPEVSAA